MTNLPGWIRQPKNPKPTVEFNLPGPQQDVAHIYRTNDEIKGEILFQPSSDLVIHAVQLTLEGVAHTYIWDREINWQTQYPFITHRFMRLHQPPDATSLPGTVLEGGKVHCFPFVFVVPSGLLPQACQHEHTHPEVRHQHLHLPPSLGFKSQREKNSVFSLSLDPAAASVTYNIRFRVFELHRAANRPVCVINTTRKVHILPTLPEMPPPFVPMDGAYQQSKEIIVKRLRGRKLGHLSATGKQLKAIRIGHIESEPLRTTDTILPIDFVFLPTCYNQPPPRPKKIRSKLTAMTYFGIEPLEDLPGKSRTGNLHPYRRLFMRTVSLASHNITSVRWEKVQSGLMQLQKPSQGTEPTASRSSEEASFRMTIALPITLPNHVVYTPTFSSCFISREYSLTIEASFDVHHRLPFTETISLTVPIQICSESALETKLRTKAD